MTTEVRKLVERYMPNFPVVHCGRVVEDTTEFMSINYGDVIAIGGQHYMVLRDEVERRFGVEDPKYWVKRCRVLETGERKILKLVFYETFSLKIGSFELRCHRSPEKEARILQLVRNDLRFMQGISHLDSKNNVVRVLDVVEGKQLDMVVYNIEANHETYFHEHFPDILDRFVGACEAIGFLHSRWEKHGDVRRDHLWVEYDSNRYRWIDFDYAFDFQENPFGLDIFGLGNILQHLVGKGTHTQQTIVEKFGPEKLATLTTDDFSLMFPHRLSNLRKLFPYIPVELNRVLLHFAAGSEVYYESVEELLEDLRSCCKRG